MKKLHFFATAIMLICCTTVFAQQPSQEEMAAMMVNMMPGDIQKMMAGSAGEWTAHMKMYMDPSQPPMEQSTQVSAEMILGGRYLVTKFKGMMMGMPFEGMSTTAYDNGVKKFYSSWIDNMSTGMTQMEGKWMEDGKSIEFKGVSQDPMKGTEVKMRQTLEFVDNDTQRMVMYMEDHGKEMKSMEIELKRNK